MRIKRLPCRVALIAVLLAAPAANAATIEIIQGQGFDDTTPRDPVDGNPGTTIGAQRSFAVRYAANLLETKIISSVPIRIQVNFTPEDCSEGTAVTGRGGPLASEVNFPHAPKSDVLYPIALANALTGEDRLPQAADIGLTFNERIDDDSSCAFGPDYYYGYENTPAGGDIDFVATALHEFIHGLGFISNVDVDTGEFIDGDPDRTLPNVFDTLTQDFDFNARFWPELSVNERQSSIQGGASVVSAGNTTTGSGAPTLIDGTTNEKVRIYAPIEESIPGSSVSHWSNEVRPNDLMEANDTGDIRVNDGLGLATCLLQDIGWALQKPQISCPDNQQVDPDEIKPADSYAPIGGASGDTNGGGTANSSGGGGGCALAGDAMRPDPLLPLLVAAALFGLSRRRFSRS